MVKQAIKSVNMVIDQSALRRCRCSFRGSHSSRLFCCNRFSWSGRFDCCSRFSDCRILHWEGGLWLNYASHELPSIRSLKGQEIILPWLTPHAQLNLFPQMFIYFLRIYCLITETIIHPSNDLPSHMDKIIVLDLRQRVLNELLCGLLSLRKIISSDNIPTIEATHYGYFSFRWHIIGSLARERLFFKVAADVKAADDCRQ